MNRSLLLLALAPAFVLSACGGSSSSTTASDTGSTASSSPGASPVSGGGTGLHVASTTLGKVLVDSQGRTVYMLTADSPGHSSCSAACLQYWPAVAPGKAAPTVTAKVSSTTTTGGQKIATAGGWPLYTFIQDQKPGDVTGEGVQTFGGVWYAVSPSGTPVKSASSGGSSSSGSYTGRGY